MEKEQQLLDSFQVEELEKRFEMGWVTKPGDDMKFPDDGQTIDYKYIDYKHNVS